MSLTFLDHPGAQERHCQRQYKNPLFTVEVRELTEQQLNVARHTDEQEQQQFFQLFHQLLNRVAELKPNEKSEVMLELKAELEQCYEQCCGLTGEHPSELAALVKLVDVIMLSIRQGATGDAEAEHNLNEEELARKTHFQLLQYPLIVDLLRPNSPIVHDQLVATLLTESEEAIEAAFQLFDKAHQQLICQQVEHLLNTKQVELKQGNQADLIREKRAISWSDLEKKQGLITQLFAIDA
jgi:hypothetical protein